MIGPWFGGALNETNHVFRQLLEHGQNLLSCRQGDEQPARQTTLQMSKGIGTIDLVAIWSLADRRGLQHGQGVEIIGQHLGPEILLRGQPGQAGGVLQAHAMFEAFEGLLDAPAAVIQVRKALGGVGRGIQQGRDQRMDTAIGRHHANQSHPGRGRRTAIIGAVPRIGYAQGHRGFRQTGAQKGLDRREAGIIGAHTEGDALLSQTGHQPPSGIAAIEDQQIAGIEGFQMLEQHLPLARRRRVQPGCQGHLQAWQIQGEGDGLSDPATGGVLQEQLQLGRIGGHHAQAVPERDGQAFLDERQQACVEGVKGQVGEVLARLGEGLGADLANQVRLVRQMREEGIELVLYARLEAGEHRHHQNGKGQNALAKESVGFKARLSEEFVGMETLEEPDKNALVLRSSWKITFNIN
jgi:hypothetical protein